jgi:hypothetical protein
LLPAFSPSDNVHIRGMRTPLTLFVCAASVLVLFCFCEPSTKPQTQVSAPNALSSAADAACRSSAKALCDRALECSPKLVDFFFGGPQFCESDVFHRCAVRYEGISPNANPASCESVAKTTPCEQFKDLVKFRTFASADDQLLLLCPLTPGSGKENEGGYSEGDCESGFCVRAKKGQPCGVCAKPQKEGDGCVGELGQCAAPLRCESGKCIRLRSEGEVCASHASCAGAACGADGHCSKLAILDERCDREAGPACDLGLGLACDFDKTRTCRPFSIVPEGAECDPASFNLKPDVRFCVGSGSRANCEDGRCLWLSPVPRDHRECTSDNECLDLTKPTENALCMNRHCTAQCGTTR